MANQMVEIPIELSVDSVSIQGHSLAEFEKLGQQVGKDFSKAFGAAAEAGISGTPLKMLTEPMEQAMSNYRQALNELRSSVSFAQTRLGQGAPSKERYSNRKAIYESAKKTAQAMAEVQNVTDVTLKVLSDPKWVENLQIAETKVARLEHPIQTVSNILKSEWTRQLQGVNGLMDIFKSKVSDTVASIKNMPTMTPDIGRVAPDDVWKQNNVFEEYTNFFAEIKDLGVKSARIKNRGIDLFNAFANLDTSKIKELVGDIALASPTLQKFAGQVQNVVTPLNESNTAAKNTRHSVNALVKAFSKLGKSGHKSSGSVNRSMQKLKKSMFQLVLGFRSLYFLIRRLRNTFIDSMKEMTKSVPFLNTQVSQMVMAFNQLKGSLGTAFQPIASVVIPLLTTLMNTLTQCMYTIGKFFAVLTGQNVIYKATARQVDYAKSLGATAGSAKAADKALAKFDTINILGNKDADTGGGAGAGAGYTLSPAEIDPDDAVSEFAQKVKEAWRKSDFTEVGTIVGTKLNEALLTINWPSIQTLAYNLGKDLATAINGFVSAPDFAQNLGITLGEAVNTAIQSLAGFMDSIDFLAVASAFATGISNFIMTVDWGLLASSVLKGIVGALLIAFAGMGALLMSILAQIFLPIATWFSDTMWSIDEKVQTFFRGLGAAFEETRQKFMAWLNRVVTNVKNAWEELKLTVSTNIENAKQMLSEFFTNVKTTVGGWLDNLTTKFKTFWDKLKTNAKNGVTRVKNTVVNIFKSIRNGVIGALNGIINAYNNVVDTINGFSISIPSWVPGIGGNSWHPNLSHRATIPVPALAKGGVIPPNAPFMAMLGDQKHGTNIEAPLDTIVSAFRQAQSEQPINVNIEFTGNLAQLARILKPAIDTENNRVGGSLVIGGVR